MRLTTLAGEQLCGTGGIVLAGESAAAVVILSSGAAVELLSDDAAGGLEAADERLPTDVRGAARAAGGSWSNNEGILFTRSSPDSAGVAGTVMFSHLSVQGETRAEAKLTQLSIRRCRMSLVRSAQ